MSRRASREAELREYLSLVLAFPGTGLREFRNAYAGSILRQKSPSWRPWLQDVKISMAAGLSREVLMCCSPGPCCLVLPSVCSRLSFEWVSRLLWALWYTPIKCTVVRYTWLCWHPHLRLMLNYYVGVPNWTSWVWLFHVRTWVKDYIRDRDNFLLSLRLRSREL